jgi:hypothetical protein
MPSLIARATITSVAILALLSAPGCAAQSREQFLTPQQVAMIKATCQTVMHIGYHNAIDLDACTTSLSDSLTAKTLGDLDLKIEEDCVAQGLARGTPAFSMCVVDRHNGFVARVTHANSAMASARTGPVQLAYDAQKDNSQAYYDSSFDTKRRREQYSCAQLGIDPASSAFGQCVAGLDADLFHADHPSP